MFMIHHTMIYLFLLDEFFVGNCIMYYIYSFNQRCNSCLIIE